MKRKMLRQARRALNELDSEFPVVRRNLSGLKLMWYGLVLFVYGDIGE